MAAAGRRKNGGITVEEDSGGTAEVDAGKRNEKSNRDRVERILNVRELKGENQKRRMGLRLVYGRAGSGKTAFCLREIENSLKMPGVENNDMKTAPGSGQVKRIDNDGFHNACTEKAPGGISDACPLILIVPEQFSLQAEKNLAKIPAAPGMRRAEALSFRRLAFRVFNEVGGVSRQRLDSAGKSMLLFKIADKLEKELKVYSKASFKRGFAAALSDAVAEFKRCGITPARLAEASEKLKEGLPLKDRLHDLAIIFGEFEKQLHEKYIDADDILDELYDRLDKSAMFNGAEVWIDEFSGFTRQEYKVIGKLLKKAARVTVCLCLDHLPGAGGEAPSMVFEPAGRTAAKLLEMAESEGIEVENPVALGQDGTVSPRFSCSEALGHLEKNFYRYPYEVYKKQTFDICISASSNPYSEVEDCARDIIRLCRDEGYRYRNIAVSMRNPDSYGSLIKSIFSRYGIPFFMDGKREIDGHPLIVFILAALEIFTDNWSYESVFRYVKTGFSGLEREEADMLENYVLANGIRGSAWTKEEDWDYPPEFETSGILPSSAGIAHLEVINAARRKLAEPLASFRKKIKGGATAREFCTALFELLCETGAGKKADAMSRRLAAGGFPERADECRQVWNIIMDVFSQVVEVLGDEKAGIGRFSEILSAGFANHKISLIPPAIDQVLVSGIERVKGHDIKALYVLGANEGIIPAAGGNEGLLSDIDRDSLENLGIELSANTRSRCLEERFMIYTAFATPSRYLWLGYPAADREGRALRPSHVISEIRRIMPFVAVRGSIAGKASGKASMPATHVAEASRPEAPVPSALRPTFDEMAVQLRKCYDGEKIHDGWREIYKWFCSNGQWKDKCAGIIKSLDCINRAERLSRDRTRALYGKPLFASVSRLEAFASCPFLFYAKYGLAAKERKIFGFTPVDAGTFMHEIISEFSRTLVKRGMSWRKLDGEWCRAQVSELVDRLLEKHGNAVLKSSKRYLYISGRLKKIAERAVLLVARHVESGGFEPVGYEVEFGDRGRYPPIEVKLPEGGYVKLTGRIDRIDAMESEDGTYYRIIDYKSGNRGLKLADVYYGLQLQLIAYLDAVLGIEGNEAGTTGSEAVGRIAGGSGAGMDDGTDDGTGAGMDDGTDDGTGAEIRGNPPVPKDRGNGAASTSEAGASASAGDGSMQDRLHPGSGNTRKAFPAGILYFRLDDPLVRPGGRNATDEEIERAIMKELRMKGLILADVRLIKEMDRNMEGDSLIIPARINKDGSMGRSSAATPEQFTALRRHVRKMLAKFGKEIMDGNVDISPYKIKLSTACDYCGFSPVCRFDTSNGSNRYRLLADLGEEELWSRMNGCDDVPETETGGVKDGE